MIVPVDKVRRSEAVHQTDEFPETAMRQILAVIQAFRRRMCQQNVEAMMPKRFVMLNIFH